MKGFGGFGNSPVKQKTPGDGLDWTLNDNLNKAVRGEGPGSPNTLYGRKDFLKKNTIKTTSKKLWRPLGPGTRPFAPNVTKVLRPIAKRGGKIGLIAGTALAAYNLLEQPINKAVKYILNKKDRPRDMSKDVLKQGR